MHTDSFWRNKRVFLTGHTGFKGGWMALWLHSLGANVTGFALPPATSPCFFDAVRMSELVEHHEGDIRDLAALTQAIVQARPDIIIHMAAQPLVRYSYREPVETYATNVMGTVHLLEAARAYGKAAVTLVITTDKCYANREQWWSYREHDALGGHDPYSSSKACAELVTEAYTRSFFIPSGACGAVGSVRAGNVIGGGDWAEDRLIPDMVRALSSGGVPIVRRPGAVRPWQHVLEPIAGYMRAVEYLYAKPQSEPQVWNFGPEHSGEVDVLRVASVFCEAWGKGKKPDVRPDPNAPHEAHLLTLDHTKARKELGWSPRWPIEETLTRTAQWYLAYYNQSDMRAFSLDQINDYLPSQRSAA